MQFFRTISAASRIRALVTRAPALRLPCLRSSATPALATRVFRRGTERLFSTLDKPFDAAVVENKRSEEAEQDQAKARAEAASDSYNEAFQRAMAMQSAADAVQEQLDQMKMKMSPEARLAAEQASDLESFEELVERADKKDPNAMFSYGWSLIAGDGIERDVNRGVELMIQAAEQGNVHAMTVMGLAYVQGDGVGKETSYGLELLECAAKAGHHTALFNLGSLYAQGIEGELERDYNKAIDYWTQAGVEKGRADANYCLYHLYQEPDFPQRDVARAIEYLQLAAAREHPESQFLLGLMCAHGSEHVEQDSKQAVALLEKAAKHGHPVACAKMGHICSQGLLDVPIDMAQALNHFQTGSKEGSAECDFFLGMHKMQGIGCEVDEAEALVCWGRAAANGVSSAAFNIGLTYAQQQDFASAAKWWEEAAAAGDMDAQANLGILYANGDGVEQSDEQAMKLFNKAAAAGSADALYNLALVHLHSDEYKDEEKARHLLQRAANAGHAEAQRICTTPLPEGVTEP